jgi:transcriptional regulator with XRE-family HTH domain
MTESYDGLIEFIAEVLRERGWSVRKLARQAGVSHVAVSGTLAGQRTPGADFCVKLAAALDEPPERLLRLAGILPPLPPGDEALQAQVVEAFRHLSVARRREVLAYTRWQLERERQADDATAADADPDAAAAAT